MRLYDLPIDGNVYTACCGLHALEQLQNQHGSLDVFEKKLIGDAKENTQLDIATVRNTARLFLEDGAKASGSELTKKDIESIVDNAGGVYDLAANLYVIFSKSIASNVDEKNKESQTETE